MSLSSEFGAAELMRQLDAGLISVQEYASETIQRIDQQSKLNAIVSFDSELLLEQARRADSKRQKGDVGKLCGLPLVVKDNINTVVFPTTGGTKSLKNHTPEKNSGSITALEKSDAIIAAKSGMHEMAFGITSNNAFTGAIRNPHDLSKISGGSSGGTAAAIAGGIFPAGLGTDTGGSCRIPAALCGVVGFRPTTGRYASDGVIPISHTRDTIGTIGKRAEDIALLDGVLSGVAGKYKKKILSQITLGISEEVLFDNLEPEVETAVQAQLQAIEAAGARLVDVNISDIWAHNEAFSFPVVFYEVMRDLPCYLKEHAPHISFKELIKMIGSPDVVRAFASQLGDEAMPESAYRAAMDEHRPAMRSLYSDTFKQKGLTALVFPTTPLRARDIGQDETIELNGEQVPTFPTYIRNTDLGSNLGVPGITLPCQKISGLPIGIEFDGIIGGDKQLIELALAVEDVLAL